MNEYKFIVTVKHRHKLNKPMLARDIKDVIRHICPFRSDGEVGGDIKNVSVKSQPKQLSVPEEAIKALEFYANASNWEGPVYQDHTNINMDCGFKAAWALKLGRARK